MGSKDELGYTLKHKISSARSEARKVQSASAGGTSCFEQLGLAEGYVVLVFVGICGVVARSAENGLKWNATAALLKAEYEAWFNPDSLLVSGVCT
jgi:hypothetical protein